METNETFQEIKRKVYSCRLGYKIEIYTTVQGLSVEQYKRALLGVFPIKYLDKLEKRCHNFRRIEGLYFLQSFLFVIKI